MVQFKEKNNYGRAVLPDTSPDSIVFAIDIHRVLIRPNIPEMIRILLKARKRATIFILCNPVFWYNILHNGAIDEQWVDDLSARYHEQGITKKFLIHLINTQKLNKDMIALMTVLKKQGYTLYVASNIWRELFIQLREQFNFFAELFTGYYYPSVDGNYVEKPNPAYYKGFKSYLSHQGLSDKKIIFIDENKKNVLAARKQGFVALRFTTVEQLLIDLNKI